MPTQWLSGPLTLSASPGRECVKQKRACSHRATFLKCSLAQILAFSMFTLYLGKFTLLNFQGNFVFYIENIFCM